jgi:hypothetical protein
MSKKIAGMLAALLFAAVVVYGADVWKDKDFDKWDQKDVDKILKDSPWSKAVQYGGGGTGAMDAALSTPGSDAAHDGSGGGGGGGGNGRNGLSASGTMGASQGMGAATNFFVRWYSSRTVREAMARQREINGTPADEARKSLEGEIDTYEVLLQSNNLAAFAKEGEAALKDHSYLMLKSNKDKIAPSKVTLIKGQGDRVAAVQFDFPRKNATGEPSIGPSEKNIEFFTKAGTTPLSVSFEISKMVDKKGVDF